MYEDKDIESYGKIHNEGASNNSIPKYEITRYVEHSFTIEQLDDETGRIL